MSAFFASQLPRCPAQGTRYAHSLLPLKPSFLDEQYNIAQEPSSNDMFSMAQSISWECSGQILGFSFMLVLRKENVLWFLVLCLSKHSLRPKVAPPSLRVTDTLDAFRALLVLYVRLKPSMHKNDEKRSQLCLHQLYQGQLAAKLLRMRAFSSTTVRAP